MADPASMFFHGAGFPDFSKLELRGQLDGFPVLGRPGSPTDLKQDEVEAVELRYVYRSKMFSLWEEKDKEEFDGVNDKIVNGLFRLFKRADTWEDEHKHYRVWLEWAQIYSVLPDKPGAKP